MASLTIETQPIDVLELRVARAAGDADAWQALGFAYAAEQRMSDAVIAFARAASLNPGESRTALAHAWASLDAGRPGVALFERAQQFAPDDLSIVNGRSAALLAQGRSAAAESLLVDTLTRHPTWLAGHKALATLRYTSGDTRDFARGYAAACAEAPRSLPLRLAWFGAMAQIRDWPAALRIITEGERIIGAVPAFAASRAFVAAESGDRALAEELFAQTTALHDEVLDVARMRHCLRTGQVEKAESVALGLMQGRSAHSIWPYLSLIWRLRGDVRAEWLDGAAAYIRVFDLDYTVAELAELAVVLRRLHTARAPHIEQSVRGGTQTDTDRQLFLRGELEIQKVRAKVRAAIGDYVAALPPPLSGHPLLDLARDKISFSGSWSVRLAPQGFHVSHTHPMGWISSALYVALPPPTQRGEAPAGYIRFGVPPRELGLLAEYAQVEPKPGRLVLFPSTMWHETVPFDAGERLVIAFDVSRPRV